MILEFLIEILQKICYIDSIKFPKKMGKPNSY